MTLEDEFSCRPNMVTDVGFPNTFFQCLDELPSAFIPQGPSLSVVTPYLFGNILGNRDVAARAAMRRNSGMHAVTSNETPRLCSWANFTNDRFALPHAGECIALAKKALSAAGEVCCFGIGSVERVCVVP